MQTGIFRFFVPISERKKLQEFPVFGTGIPGSSNNFISTFITNEILYQQSIMAI